MIKVVHGGVFHVNMEEVERDPQMLKEFFASGAHDEDLICIDHLAGDRAFVSGTDIENGTIDTDCYVHLSVRMFREARANPHMTERAVLPVINARDEVVCLLQMNTPQYFHIYDQITEAPDTRVFSLFDCVVLTDVTEYAFVLLCEVLSGYTGTVVCYGPDWLDIREILPVRDNLHLVTDEQSLAERIVQGKTMYLSEFLSTVENYQQRCENGLFSYDEIMALSYLFSYGVGKGNRQPDKKYYRVNPVFPMEGLVSMCDKLSGVAPYIEASGYIPVFYLTRSQTYSDNKEENVWSKFFRQPYVDDDKVIKDAMHVVESPYAMVTFSDRYLMRRITDCKEISLVSTAYYNDRVLAEVEKERKAIGFVPERTIGVLIRGTDYTVSRVLGHNVMATPAQVMDKVREFEANGRYDHVFLSTEDADILEEMKTLCGDRLQYTSQKRYRIHKGELLAQLKPERENDGWLKGVEYLVTLKLLSECAAFIASGHCGGVQFAMAEGGAHFQDSYVFDLGVNH